VTITVHTGMGGGGGGFDELHGRLRSKQISCLSLDHLSLIFRDFQRAFVFMEESRTFLLLYPK